MADRFESLMSLLGDDVSVRWLITLLHFLWQGAVVGGVVAIAGRLLRGASARPRYALYSAALLSLPVWVAVTFCVVDVPASLQSSSQPESPADIPAKSSALPSQATTITAAVQMETAEATDVPVLSHRVVKNAATMRAVDANPKAVDDNSESQSHSPLAMLSRAAPWIAVAYVVGVACFLLRLLTALWGGHRLRTRTAHVTDAKLLRLIADQADRVKLRCVPVVAYCERVAMPTVLGVLRPMVLLPASLMTGLTPDEFAAIIRHELAHIRRYHLWMNLLQRVIESLLFFHPVVWFISRRLSAEREVCCDDLVVSSGYEPMHYAGALLRMAELCANSRLPDALVLAATGDRTPLLERRIERLMNWGNTPRLQLTRAGMAGLLMTLVSLIVVPGIAHTWAQAQAAEDEAAAKSRTAEDEPAAKSRTSEDEPAAKSRTAEDEPPAAPAPATEMKPKHEDAQTLFKEWQANARTDGKIPGALIGKLGAKVKYFISLNKDDRGGHDLAVRFEQLLPRFETAGDWTESDVIALLDDVSAIHRIPLRATLEAAAERIILAGEPLPAELVDAAWGQPTPDGLRVAWLLEPRAKEYPLGTSLKSRILVHNSGEETAIFSIPSWQQSSEHTAHDAKGAAIKVSSTYWTTIARMMTYRLAPGEYCETPAPGIGVGARTDDEDWANVRVGAWIEAKQGDEVRFSPAAVEVRFSASHVGVRMMNGRPLDVEARDAADLWQKIIAQRVQRELPLPAAPAERVQIIRRVTLDLFGEAPTPEEIAAFIADDAPTAQAALEKRLLHRPGIVPFTGTLPPGDIQFRVLAADPDAAKRPRVATGPGWYTLGDNQRLDVKRTPNGNRRTNKATIRFFSSDPKTDPPGKPYEIALPDGRLTYAIAWDRDSGIVWITQKGLVRSYDFTNPAQVKETRFGPGRIVNVPQRFREALTAALNVPGAPVQQEKPLKPKGGAKLDPGTEEILKWGEPVNGLRAALSRLPSLGEPKAGQYMDFDLVVQNVSNAPIRLIANSTAPNPRRLFVRRDGVTLFSLRSKEPAQADFMLQPRRVAVIRLLPERTAGRSIAENPDLTFCAEMEIEHAPAGAWTGRLYIGETSGAAAAGKLQPKDESAQSLFKKWQAIARTDGKIPGALMGLVAEQLESFIKQHPGDEKTPKLAALRWRFDTSHDWEQADVVALLDAVTAISTEPVSSADMPITFSNMQPTQGGKPLPVDLEGAVWGKPARNGLRAAWLMEPLAEQDPPGSVRKARVLLHNTGKGPAFFRTQSWQRADPHTAGDAKDGEINDRGTLYTVLTPMVTYRLAPGEYSEVSGHRIKIGTGEYADEYAVAILGAVNEPEANVSEQVHWWYSEGAGSGGSLNIAKRVANEAPMPKSVADRGQLIRRVTLDVFGEPPTAEEITAFTADDAPDALAKLTTRLQAKKDIMPIVGTLSTDQLTFQVSAADPAAAKAAHTATGPGRYVLGDSVHLQVSQTTTDSRRTNKATIVFISPDPKVASPHKPYEIALPDGSPEYAFAWERGTSVLWLSQKGLVRRYDFTNPAKIEATRFEPGSITDVPEH